MYNKLFLLICMNVEVFKWNYMVNFGFYLLYLIIDLELFSLVILVDILNIILSNNEIFINR